MQPGVRKQANRSSAIRMSPAPITITISRPHGPNRLSYNIHWNYTFKVTTGSHVQRVDDATRATGVVQASRALRRAGNALGQIRRKEDFTDDASTRGSLIAEDSKHRRESTFGFPGSRRNMREEEEREERKCVDEIRTVAQI